MTINYIVPNWTEPNQLWNVHFNRIKHETHLTDDTHLWETKEEKQKVVELFEVKVVELFDGIHSSCRLLSSTMFNPTAQKWLKFRLNYYWWQLLQYSLYKLEYKWNTGFGTNHFKKYSLVCRLNRLFETWAAIFILSLELNEFLLFFFRPNG